MADNTRIINNLSSMSSRGHQTALINKYE